MATAGGRGRPRISSAADLQEAAAELFLEQGYEATTIDDVATRVGVSRGTFFSYLDAKSDCLWFELRAVMDRVEPHGPLSVDEAVDVVVAACEPLGTQVPWVLRDAGTIGAGDVLRETAIAHLEPVVRRLQGALALGRHPRSTEAATAIVAVTASAVLDWAIAGQERSTADTAVREALEPLARAYQTSSAA